MLDMKFVFNLDKNKDRIIYEDDLDRVRGLYFIEDKHTIINLGAKQFKESIKYGENIFINELTQTIVHETCHYLIDRCFYGPLFHTILGEERVCNLLSC